VHGSPTLGVIWEEKVGIDTMIKEERDLVLVVFAD
jgi:hypothetical protein